MSIAKVRLSLSLSSWFCLPDQGMKDFEILSRASAFVCKARTSDKFRYKYHVVTSSHVVAPWRWPKYYSEPWLKQVNEQDTHYSVELRFPNGIFETQSELFPIHYHHPSKDLAVLHFLSEDSMMPTLQKHGLQVLDFATDQDFSSHLTDLEYHGHDVTGGVSADEDTRVPVPRTILGSYSHKTLYQTFARSVMTLPDGMCGGPIVINPVNPETNKKTPLVCGIVEGIVPLTHSDENLRGLVSYATAREIQQFLRDIEEKKVAPLVGGQAINAVAGDKDPKKMDIAEVFRRFES